jgi:hypothetical protein
MSFTIIPVSPQENLYTTRYSLSPILFDYSSVLIVVSDLGGRGVYGRFIGKITNHLRILVH